MSFVALHLAAQRQSFPELEACHLATLSGEEVLCLQAWVVGTEQPWFFIGARDLN